MPSRTPRQGDIDALLDLWSDLAPAATPAVQKSIQMRSKPLRLAVSQTVWRARRLDASCVVGAEAVALLAWAELRRTVCGPPRTHVLQDRDPAWCAHASDCSGLPGITLSAPVVPWSSG